MIPAHADAHPNPSTFGSNACPQLALFAHNQPASSVIVLNVISRVHGIVLVFVSARLMERFGSMGVVKGGRDVTYVDKSIRKHSGGEYRNMV